MATQQQKNELINVLIELKKECDGRNDGPNGQVFVYISLKISNFIFIIDKFDSSVLSETVISDLIYWTNNAINAMQAVSPDDDIPALNIIIGKLSFQFP